MTLSTKDRWTEKLFCARVSIVGCLGHDTWCKKDEERPANNRWKMAAFVIPTASFIKPSYHTTWNTHPTNESNKMAANLNGRRGVDGKGVRWPLITIRWPGVAEKMGNNTHVVPGNYWLFIPKVSALCPHYLVGYRGMEEKRWQHASYLTPVANVD